MTGRLPLSVNKSAAGGESTSPLCDSALEGSGVSFPLQGDQKRKPAEPYALVRIREEPATRRPPVGGNHGRPAATDFRSAGDTLFLSGLRRALHVTGMFSISPEMLLLHERVICK